MAITYNIGTGRITITGYSAVTPCTFQDVYNADKAGTLSLHARAGVAAVDGAPVAVDRAERPADYVVLGGASNDLYITVTNWVNMNTATIRVTGTDRDGAAQTDDVVVNANGNFSTAKWFKTVTHTQITVFTKTDAGSFDYDLIQGQWGVSWKQSDKQFLFVAVMIIGTGVAPGHFGDERKQFVIDNSGGYSDYGIFVDVNSTFRLGTLIDAGLYSVEAGCSYKIICNGDQKYLIGSWGSMHLYGCDFESSHDRTRIKSATSNGRIWHCILSKYAQLMTWTSADSSVYDVFVSGVEQAIESMNSTMEDLSIVNCTAAVIVPNGTYTITELKVRDCTFALSTWIFHGIVYGVNWDVDDWAFNWAGGSTGAMHRQYAFNLRVVDSDGVGIQSVTVSMDDRLGANVFSVSTDASGDIAEQIVTYGYYDAANGDTIQPGGLGYSPHTVTISKAGYATRTIVYTMDRKREEIEKLGGAAPHGMEYRRRRVPGEVSAMAEYE